MTTGTRAVKTTAKTALKNKTGAIFASCAVILCVFVCILSASMLSFAFSGLPSGILLMLLSFFLIFPLFIGLLRYFWRMIFGVDDNPISVFYYLSAKKLYFKVLRLIVLLFLRLLCLVVVFYLPTFVVWLLSQGFVYEMLDASIPLWSTNFDSVLVFMQSISSVLVFIFMLKYYITPVLFVADDSIDVHEAIHMSTVISKKTLLDFISLIFSFLGWILLSVLVIPLIFTLPYAVTSYAVHVRFAIAEYNIFVSKNYNPNNLENDTYEFS